ncbi:Nucleoside-triphosphatase rdgB [Caldalkalibacillus thermarum TA2.A1]|uniref:dITP/XTP pyrophosphatase n=1 Tax=Caldalkalibacillus thermarum (strain TA2.A1) TaxID=986075 RepID=F5LAJ3_CALTT|nr:XTP/dITP diphosphatase [Caldalkalibacillus thermarum]EGL81565.1 Nucleoside-triphosphatase rdgB [Caldalkalibacillus thermarum TA2.A1]QZT33544.1 XTP/dITP diphosphatase [Caldalkalibacillus thermarum TA2.A1]
MKVLLATKNRGKQKEYAMMLKPLGIQVLTLEDMPGEAPDVVEDGATFEENALKKAEAYHRHYKLPAMADDSGLTVDALEGRPGVFSARYAGEHASDEDNIAKLLAELEGIPLQQRTARFICVIAYVDGQGDPIIAKGSCEGQIALQPSGSFGFGYDPVFYLPSFQKTMAQLPPEEKNRISHRFNALKNFVRNLSDRGIGIRG